MKMRTEAAQKEENSQITSKEKQSNQSSSQEASLKSLLFSFYTFLRTRPSSLKWVFYTQNQARSIDS